MENNSQSPTLPASRTRYPSDRPFWWVTVVGVVTGLVLALFGTLIYGVAVWLSGRGLPLTAIARPDINHMLQGFTGVQLQTIAEIPAIAFVLYALPQVGRRTLRDFGFRAAENSDWAPIAIGVVAMFVIVTALGSAFSATTHFKGSETAVAIFNGMHGWQRAAFAVFGVVVAPVFEETVFRLLLFNAMRTWWGFWPGAVVSSLLFGMAHAQPPFSQGAMWLAICAPLAAGGMILCAVYNKTGKAWASMVTHGTFNLLSLLLVIAFPQLAK